jgi:hypothetical protein
VLVHILDSLRIGVNLSFVIAHLDQLIVELEDIAIDLLGEVVNLVLEVLFLGTHLDLHLQHTLLDSVEFCLAARSLLVVDSHLEQVDPVIKCLILLLETQDFLAIILRLLHDWVHEFSDHNSDPGLELHEVKIFLHVDFSS